jgi:peptidyl-prolyl cis-trans isomerase SurA
MVRKGLLTLLVLAALAAPAAAVIVDRVAAVVDRQVITLSELDQLASLRFLEQRAGESDEEFRRRLLEAMIAQMLRFRDVERFGAEDVPADSIEARLLEIVRRFPTREAFDAALVTAQMTEEELRAIVKRQLQVESYIEERFSPLIFVSLEEIERYYASTWVPQRRARGLDTPAVGEVREEIRTLLRAERLQEEVDRWTTQLRARANVDVYVYR